MKEVDAGGAVISTPDRARLWEVQTPQVFDADLLARAHREVGEDVTDDAAMVELLGGTSGIGFRMNHFFYLFEIDGLLAYTMAFVVVMLLIEIAFVEPLERRLTRWRK